MIYIHMDIGHFTSNFGSGAENFCYKTFVITKFLK